MFPIFEFRIARFWGEGEGVRVATGVSCNGFFFADFGGFRGIGMGVGDFWDEMSNWEEVLSP